MKELFQGEFQLLFGETQRIVTDVALHPICRRNILLE